MPEDKNKTNDSFYDETDEIERMDLLLDSDNKSDYEVHRNDIVTGEIIQSGKEFVFVNLNAKIDGKIPVTEFEKTPKVGDKVEAAVVSINNQTGDILLSIQQCQKIKTYQKIKDALKKDGYIDGTVVDKRNDKYIVDIGFQVQIPEKEFINRIDENTSIIGKTLKFKVIKFVEKKDLIILSRKSYLFEYQKIQRKNLLENLKVGMVFKGIVRDIKDYGVFVDIGGMDGMIKLQDLSWKRNVKPEEILHKGEEIDVVVLNIEEKSAEEKSLSNKKKSYSKDLKISLGYKQLKPNPWDNINARYKVGDKVHGKVVRVFDWGAFIELEEGIDGLAPRTEISWSVNLKSPKKLLKVGDYVDAKIISIDRIKHRIGLSLKELLPDPWNDVKKYYKVGQRVSGEIVKIIDRGVFIRLDDYFEGFLSVDDVSWTDRKIKLSERFKIGDSIDTVILDIVPQYRRIKVGLKQFEANPWEVFQNKYGTNSVVKGKIKEVTTNGIVVELENGCEGFINIREIEREKSENLAEHFKVGEEIGAAVLDIKVDEGRIKLSQKRYDEFLQRQEMEKFMKSDSTKETERLGDFIGWKNKDDKKE